MPKEITLTPTLSFREREFFLTLEGGSLLPPPPLGGGLGWGVFPPPYQVPGYTFSAVCLRFVARDGVL